MIIYCDGATSNNGMKDAVGGWGYVILNDNKEYLCSNYGGEKDTTNQRMELTACLKALEIASLTPSESISIFTDSAYLCNCFNQKWYKNWMNNGWTNAKRQPVANRDLWEQLINYFNSIPFITFNKVKGHSGDKWNEKADRLAVLGKAEME